MSYAPKMRMDFAYSFIIFKIAFKRDIKKNWGRFWVILKCHKILYISLKIREKDNKVQILIY